MITLRPYQQEALDNVRRAFRGVRRVILTMPTGAGKTATSTRLAQLSYAKGKRTLFLAHRKEIVDQLDEALRHWDVPTSLILANQRGALPNPKDVHVASLQSLVRKDYRQDYDLIVVDECHHAVEGSQYERILDANPNAYVLGLTATPCRLDGRGLSDFFDAIVEGPTVHNLIDSGYLVRPVVFAPSIPILKGAKTVGGDWNARDIENIMSGSVTGSAVGEFARRGALPAVCFCATARHAEETRDLFRQAGYRSETLLGATPKDERSLFLRQLADGALDVLTSVDVISEGTDIPSVATAILLRPTQSLVKYRQQVGRALRPADGKEKAIILDHAGNSLRHGLPTDDGYYGDPWSLEGRPKRRKEMGPAAKRCDSCYAVSRASAAVCSDCGMPFGGSQRPRNVKVVDGELVEVTSLPPLKRELSKAKTFNDLLRIERERGYKKGWAWHIYISRRRLNHSTA